MSTLVRCVARVERRQGRVAPQYFSRMLSSRLRDLANRQYSCQTTFEVTGCPGKALCKL